jgi:hypothetical protein
MQHINNSKNYDIWKRKTATKSTIWFDLFIITTLTWEQDYLWTNVETIKDFEADRIEDAFRGRNNAVSGDAQSRIARTSFDQSRTLTSFDQSRNEKNWNKNDSKHFQLLVSTSLQRIEIVPNKKRYFERF